MAFESEQAKLDIRLYVGLLFFRWQIIALCFLYCLLAGVLYIHLTPKLYRTQCVIMPFRDPNSIIGGGNPFASMHEHRFLLTSQKVRDRVVSRLMDQWGKTMGGRAGMFLPISVGSGRYMGPTLVVSTQSRNPRYAEAYLTALLEEHRTEWDSMQKENSNNALKTLEKELATLDEKIKEASDDLIEYQRVNDVSRITLRGQEEAQYLSQLSARRRSIMTEIMLLEEVFPKLKDASEAVVSDVRQLTSEIAAIGTENRTSAPRSLAEVPEEEAGTLSAGSDEKAAAVPMMTLPSAEEKSDLQNRQWVDLRVQLTRLRLREQELLENLEPTHPQVQAVQKQIRTILKQLDMAAEMAVVRMRERYKALQIQLNAVEQAEYQWQAQNYFASQRFGDMSRYQSTLKRYEQAYRDLFTRRHDMLVSEELKIEHFRIITPVYSNPNPVWPDPMKILLMAVGIGLASGLGIALGAHILDNKIQSIADVERELGITYLGGVPFWVHSGLEKSIRPIVTEEHSTGAVEAYRALRTTIVAALTKLNEKVFFVTSADSREGKTLTVLNIAIMLAQMNKKVLLLDMDLRRGRLHRSLGLEKDPGVSDVLRGGLHLRDVIQHTKIDNLDFVPAGTFLDDAAELLQSSSLMNMLVELQNEYDFICSDTSPVLRVTDTVIMVTQGVGVVVYVARVNHTPKPLIRYSLEMLKDARVLGLIMNSIEMHKVSSLYYTYQYPNYAYYSNAYAYGYNYYYYGDGRSKAEGIEPPQPARRKSHRSAGQWFRRTFLPQD